MIEPDLSVCTLIALAGLSNLLTHTAVLCFFKYLGRSLHTLVVIPDPVSPQAVKTKSSKENGKQRRERPQVHEA